MLLHQHSFTLILSMLFSSVVIAQTPGSQIEPFIKTIPGLCEENFLDISPQVSGDHFMAAGFILQKDLNIFPNYQCDALVDQSCGGLFCWVGLIARLNLDGFVMNSWTYGELGRYTIMKGIHEFNDGTFVVLAETAIGGGPTTLLYKFNPQAQVIWGAHLGDAARYVHGWALNETSDGDLVLIGRTLPYTPTLAGERHGYIIKVNGNSGNVEFAKIWHHGISLDQFTAMVEVNDGYLCTGFTGAIDPDLRQHPILVKYDLNGNLLWSHRYMSLAPSPDISAQLGEQGAALLLNPDSSLVITYFTPNGFNVMKVNPLGDVIWANQYDGSGIEEIGSLLLAHNGNLLLGGSTRDVLDHHRQALLVELDQTGTIQRTREITNNDRQAISNMVKFTDNGCNGYLFVGGSVDSLPGTAATEQYVNPWVMKLNEELDAFGMCSSTSDIIQTPIDLLDVHRDDLVVLDSLWSIPQSQTNHQIQNTPILYHLVSDSTMPCVPQPGVTYPCIVGLNEIFDYRIRPLSIQPNPSTGDLTVTGRDLHQATSLTIYANNGSVIAIPSPRVYGDAMNFELDIPEGLYLLRMEFNDGSTGTQRFVITR